MKITRRKAIVGTLVTGGVLVVGLVAMPYPQRERERALLGHGKDAVVLQTWIKVARDNKITIYTPHQDIGQGSLSVLAQMAADEMDADWDLVSVVEAPTHEAFANTAVIRGMVGDLGVPEGVFSAFGFLLPKVARAVGLMMTGGSSAIRGTGEYGMRPAGASAREVFIKAAAKTWNVPESQLKTVKSRVIHEASGKSASYGELIDVAATIAPPSSPRLKTPNEYTLMGKPVPRLDIPEKVNGAAKYAIDVRPPGLKYAAIRQSPVFGGTVDKVDDAAVLKMRGVARVVKLPPLKGTMLSPGDTDAAVVVIADNSWRAESAVRALPVSFGPGLNGKMSTSAMFAEFESAVASEPKSDLHKQGDMAAAMGGGAKIVEASYRAPFLDHAGMEPLSATAIVRPDGTAELWVGSQVPLMARSAAADALGLKAENVTLHNHPMGGGFGRRLQVDFIVQAARVAAEMPGTPIKLTWSREECVQHGRYRPACVSRFKAAVDASGYPTGWLNVYNWQEDDAALIPYGVAHQHIGYVDAKAPVPSGAWRSVGHSRHAFFTESFIDELAHAAGVDPYAYRAKLLADAPRPRAVLDLAAAKGNWGAPLPTGWGRGIAVHKAFGSVAAQVAEVSVVNGEMKVHRIVCAIDCGRAMNPSAVEAQVQGGVLYGLSAALYGEITLNEGRVEQSNFHDYRSLQLADAPPVEVHIINSGAALGGVGEPGTPCAAPAVANALFAATGQRLRDLPLKLRPSEPSAGANL